jgi:hypothetical protein
MKRLRQVVLIGSVLLGSWMGMQAVHEGGHVIGAWATGAKVSRVVLHPLSISRTDLSINPSPLTVVWAGPLVGALLPLAAWALAAWRRMPGSFALRFFAGFCLVANGAYIAAGSIGRVGDGGEMLRHGSPAWLLWLFGAVTVPAGLGLWHCLGPRFGLGAAARPISPAAAWCSLVACVGLLILCLVISSLD